MRRRIMLAVLAGAIFILAIAGCSQQTIKIEDTGTATPAVATQAPSSTPSPTPVKTTEPEAAPTSVKTAEPSPTAKPGDGRAEIAEGFYYIKLDDDIKARIKGMSYPADDKDCEISYDDLRYVKLKHYDFDGNVKDGELIVNKKIAKEVTEIFYELYQEKYPLTSVKLVDDYGQPADDTLSMEANNTSAFCYRTVFGGGHLSRHSYGAAIDINPKLNPYLDNGRIAPQNGAQYADRTQDFHGKIDHKDLAYKLFKKHGWEWGGDWSGDKDYQHFSKDLGY